MYQFNLTHAGWVFISIVLIFLMIAYMEKFSLGFIEAVCRQL